MKINKSDKPASGRWGRLRFHLGRGEGHLLAYAWNRVRWFISPQLRWAGAFPDHVDLELSSSCNMACPMCYTVTTSFKKEVPHRNMDFDLFQRVVDQLAERRVYSIRLSWRGEPLLNPHFLECVRYARQKGIREISTLTNALRLTPELFEALVDLRLDWLTLSFDGTGKTYERIRKPAKYEEMVARIATFAEIKKRKGSAKPVIRLQGVWPAIAEDPQRYFETFEPLVDEISVNSLLDYLHRDQAIEYIEDFTCPVVFQRLVLGSDGRAFMCINDELGRVCVGDARVQSIAEIWNGPELQRIRAIHKRREGVRSLEPCRACYQPRKTVTVTHRVGERVIQLEELAGRAQRVGQ